MDHAQIARILRKALGAAMNPPSFLPLVDGIRDALRSTGGRSLTASIFFAKHWVPRGQRDRHFAMY